MNKRCQILCIVTFLFLLLGTTYSTTYAQYQGLDLGQNFDVIVLTRGLSRTLTYELSDVVWNDTSAFHVSYILTFGTGTLSIGVASASSLGNRSEIVYATTGIIGTQPIFKYAYSSGSISQSVDVPEIGIGILVTSIIVGISNPDFPVTMSMIYSLSE
jgi:hypothetical protein